jgi:hypothetical protein
MYLATGTTASERKSAGLPATAIQSFSRRLMWLFFLLRAFSSSFASFSSSLYPAIKEKKKMKLTMNTPLNLP